MSLTVRVGRRWGAAALGVALALPTSAAWAAAPLVDEPSASGVRAAARQPLPAQWWYDAMSLDEVHRVATGKGVKVAVIDGYLDPSIPDLRGARISKGDSCRGAPVPYLSGEVASHGTAMTTAIVGQGAGGRGIVGVAPDAEVRFWSFDTDPAQSLVECDGLDIGKQVDKAVAWGADVISMSIGTGSGSEDAVERAMAQGVVVVAATGAGGPLETFEYPAAVAGVVAVAAAGSDGKVWSGNPDSEYSVDQYLSVAAPGVEVPLGGFPAGAGRSWVEGATRTGTSSATAITAGAFAVLKSRWPEATGNQLVQTVLHHTSRNETGELRFTDRNGYGRISLSRAIEHDPTGYPDRNPLLMAPPQARAAYPPSVYDTSPEAADAADRGPAAEGRTTMVRPLVGAEPEVVERAAASGEQSDDGPSVPVWAVVVGVLLLLAATAAGLVVRRRRVDA